MATRLSKAAAGPGLDRGPRVPPHNLEAEESVLGACLISRQAISTALEIVGPDDFYKPAHSEVFRAMLDLYARGDPIDAVTLAEELRRRGRLDDIGGKPYIFTLVNSVPTPGSVGHYARIVQEHGVLRRLIGASHEISDIAYSVPEDVAEAVDRAEDLVYQVAQRRVSEDFQPLRELLTQNMELIEKLYERGSSITGLATGFTDLDEITAGLQAANLIILAARPSMGKSALALTVAQNVAITEKIPAVIFSLEMSKLELVQRLMCAEARVDSNRLRRGALSDSDWPKLSHALGRLAEAPLFIDDTANITIMEIRAKCRRLKSKHGLGLVIVDYLQLMQPPRRTDNRVQEVSEISRSLKILARELDLPVIAISQLSRNLEHRTDKRPVLADLRDSGCMPAATRLLRADTGGEVTLGELVLNGEQPLVWSLDEQERLVPRRLLRAFPSGVRPVFRLHLASGHRVDATGNHPFRTPGGWARLDGIRRGDLVAVPARIPPPLQAAEWCDEGLVEVGGSGRVRPRAPRGLPGGEPRRQGGSRGAGLSDISWEGVSEIVPLGVMPTFDATVDDTHNFIADGVIAHNSLEQDADLVIFIYRDEVYNQDSPQRGIAEIIISKHRNGPIGKVELAFLDHYTKFANLARST